MSSIYIRDKSKDVPWDYRKGKLYDMSLPIKDVVLVDEGSDVYQCFKLSLSLQLNDAYMSLAGKDFEFGDVTIQRDLRPRCALIRAISSTDKTRTIHFDENGKGTTEPLLFIGEKAYSPDDYQIRWLLEPDSGTYLGSESDGVEVSIRWYDALSDNFCTVVREESKTVLGWRGESEWTAVYDIGVNKKPHVVGIQPAFVLEFSKNIGDATAETVATQFNELIDKMEKCRILQRPNTKS